jgi:ABC-2 type transport system permease protein
VSDVRQVDTGLVRLIAAREIMAKLRDRVFWISAGFLIAIVAASVLIPAVFLGEDERPSLTVVTTSDPAATGLGSATRAVSAAAPDDSPLAAEVTVTTAHSAADAEEQVRSGRADAAIVAVPAGGVEVVGDRDVDDTLHQAINAAAASEATRTALTRAGLSSGEVDALYASLAKAAPPQRLLDPPSSDEEAAIGLSFLFAMLFFFTTFLFGMSIAQSVVEEKQGRVVELLLAVVPARSLLAGKVLGNLVLALGQVVVLLTAGVVGAVVAGQADVVRLLARSSAWFVVFFLLGFAMFSCLWAAAGAVASRQEELQSTTVPLQALLFVPFFAAVYVTTPGTALTVLSYIPFTAPLAMPRRLLLGDAEIWEPFLSAAIMVATAALFVMAAARLYERSILRTQSRTPWREAWTAPRA